MAEEKPSVQGELLNAKKVAALLGIRPWTVYQLVKRGALPAIRIGTRIVRFRRESIEKWMVDREAESLATGEPT
jgi:excisionase family DNA binding protein